MLGQSHGGSGSVIILWMESNDAFSGTSSSNKSYLRPILQDINLLDLWFPANCFIPLWDRKVLNAYCILSSSPHPPNILEKRGNVSQNPFCSLWPNKKGPQIKNMIHSGSLWKQRLALYTGMPCSQGGSEHPCGKDWEVQEGTFLPLNPFIMLTLTWRIPAGSIGSCCFWLSRRSSHSQQWSISTIYNFSNYFNKGNMAIPTLKVLWKFETENSRCRYCICIGVGLWACVLHWCLGECLHLKLNYSRKSKLNNVSNF